jgi:hypothetical protein
MPTGITPTYREETRGEGFGPFYEAPSILSRVLSETYYALELFPLSFRGGVTSLIPGQWQMSDRPLGTRR